MSEGGVRGIVLAHGTMSAGLVDAVRQISGMGEELLVPLSNKGLSPESIAALVRQHAVGPTILFTDLQSGSCGFAARRYCQDIPDLVMISGVSLPMLLEFALNRTLPLAQLVPRLVQKARAAIASVPNYVEADEHRAVSGR